MATITITVPDAAVARIRAAVAFNLGREPETVMGADIQAFVRDYMQGVVLRYERDMHEQAWQPEPFE